MSLSAAQRRKLPNSAFGLPKERAYPEQDKAHARDAKSRASAQEKKGRITRAQEAKIDRKANRVLGGHGSTRHGTGKKRG